MAYVKNHNPGKITMDLPWKNYIYELPLLSFSDVYGGLNLSLIFNHKMKTDDRNPYHVAEGYKLNIHKRIVFENDVPTAIEEANGNEVPILGENGTYMFQDESQRVLRVTGTTYTVENPDSSYEVYDSTGRITQVFDKYQSCVLRYQYNTLTQKLASVSHGMYMTVEFAYSYDGLSKIIYSGKEIALDYDSTANSHAITVTHYTGETFALSYLYSSSDVVGDVDSISTFCATENSTSTSYVTNVERDENVFVLTDKIGSNTVSTTNYNIHHNSNSTQNQVEITNNEGVKTRVQYEWKYPLYAYEIDSDAEFFSDSSDLHDRFKGNVELYAMRGLPTNNESAGLQTPIDGISFGNFDGNGQVEMDVSGESSASGYYIVSGWIKSNTAQQTPASEANIAVGMGVSALIPYTVDLTPVGQWKYFSCMVYAPTNKIVVAIGDHLVNTAVGNIYAKDWRYSFLKTGEYVNNESAFTNMTEYIFTDGDLEIPFREATFLAKLQGDSEYQDISGINNFVKITPADILKWKMTKRTSGSCTELYYNNCANVLQNVEGFRIKYGEQEDKKKELDELDIAVKTYAQKNVYLKRISIYENDPTAAITVQYHTNGQIGALQTFNNQFDLLTSTENGVTTTYARNARGLITAENIGTLCSRSIVYGTDGNSNTLVTVCDEYDKRTIYTMDPVWGVVTSVTLPDGTVITDTYDDDMCAMTKRTFGSTTGRFNSVIYSNGNLSSLQTGSLDYDFTYSKGKLTGVSKNNASVEAHVHTGNTKTASYYPQQSGALHSTVSHFDKYGRLSKIDGVLTNTYDLYPSFNDSGALNATVDNGGAKLAMTVDEIRGETARYDYNERGLLEGKSVTSKSNFATKISSENFTYDTKGRLVFRSTACTGAGLSTINETVEYTKGENDPAANSEVGTYTYKLGTNTKAKTVNTLDAYHRLTKKDITVDTTKFTKRFYYNVGRVTRLMDAMGTTMVGDYSYIYDAMGRIRSVDYSSASSADDYKRYTYDQYGQLIREDNLGLAKTYVYEYNSIGNVASVKAYDYTSDDELSGTPTTTSFGYTNDRLTTFGGKTIAYNSMGCPTSYEGMNAGWTKGKLSRLSSGTLASGTSSYTYQYNAFGQRVSKDYSYMEGTSGLDSVQVGQVVGYNKQYSYDHSGRLMAEKISKTLYNAGSASEQIVYLYDESGMVGMEYTAGGTTKLYYFQRNLLGDVVAIYDISGNMVARYLYDAWGNCTIGAGTTNYAVANANPIRYRGYYYDDDTGLYYCNARYYSPKWRRFISPDDTAYLDPQSVNGLNLYCYCNNDPVNLIDPSGHAVMSFLIGMGIAALIGCIVGAASYTAGQLIEYAFTGTFEWSWGGFFGAAVGGAVGGALAYTIGGVAVTSKTAIWGMKMAGAFLSGAATNAGTMIGENISGDAAYSPGDIALQSILSGVFSAASVGLAETIPIPGVTKGRGSLKAVSNQIYTKFRRGLIARITMKTFGKLLVYEAYCNLPGFLIENTYSISGAKNYVLSLI